MKKAYLSWADIRMRELAVENFGKDVGDFGGLASTTSGSGGRAGAVSASFRRAYRGVRTEPE